ncbi:MAG: hypothetical protein R2861_12445 [Desulfobacterales bacterium]
MHAADAYARATAGVCLVTLRARGHQYGHRHCHGIYGFHSHCGIYRPGAHQAHRQ